MKPRGVSVMHAFTALTMLTMANGKTFTALTMLTMANGKTFTARTICSRWLVVRETAPPFRVLEKCQDLCLRDRSGNSLVRTCNSIDFQPGARIAAFSPEPEYEESTRSWSLTVLSVRINAWEIFIKEENKRLGGPFEADVFSNMTLDECQAMCVRAEKYECKYLALNLVLSVRYFCRSIEHDAVTRQCVLSEEDSVSQKDDVTVSASPTHHFYDLVCLDNLSHRVTARGTEYPDNSVTSHLFSPGRRPDTAFQRYRNSRITGEFHSEITGRSLSECLDECLRQTSFQC
ncbi:Uncharacterized protein OBRU01_18727, partial [Operophtera brumata]